MERITIEINKSRVYEEVAKATDYTGSKLVGGDDEARDRILAADDDLANLGRFWEEAILVANDRLKRMLESGTDFGDTYEAVISVSKSFDKALTDSVESTLRGFFIAWIIGQWFKFANKAEAGEYLTQASELLTTAERLLYSRKKPTVPRD